MLDFADISRYRENNRVEAKKAAGGLPGSIWETYAAFANTIGGVILLGVEEKKDHSLAPIMLPHPQELIRLFWQGLNDPKKVSANILSERDVQLHETDGGRFVSITVPRAPRKLRPVYIDGNPLTGSYRRNGEGDYRCAPEDVLAMQRDACAASRDLTLMEALPISALQASSLEKLRQRMQCCRPGHVLSGQADEAFLLRSGAAGKGADQLLHPTAAGLLMLGQREAILQHYPAFRLTWQYQDGPWSENLCEFYLHVCQQLYDAADDALSQALEEALANTLIHADYEGEGSISVRRTKDRIVFSNPGSLRMEAEAARSGGASDPRNQGLMQLFALMGAGTGTGSGLAGIDALWRHRGWQEPELKEHFSPDRITLTLMLTPAHDYRPPHASWQRLQEQAIALLTEHVCLQEDELARLLSLERSSVRALVQSLEEQGHIEQTNDASAYQMRATHQK